MKNLTDVLSDIVHGEFGPEELKLYAKYLMAMVSVGAQTLTDAFKALAAKILFIKIGAAVLSLLLIAGIVVLVRRAFRMHKERMQV